MLGKEAKGKFAPTNQVAVRKEQAKLEKITDVTKVESSAHALDNDTFDLRLAKKDLIKQQELTPEGKKMLLFVLIDSSMSMMSQFRNAHPSFRARFLTRGVIASAFTLALGERAEKEGGILYMSFFASNVTVPLVCDDAVSFKALRNRVSLNSYNGYGTNISGALSVAFSSIAKAQATDVLTKAEILIITDCEDRIRAQDISPEQKKMLHVLDLSGLAPVSQQAKAIKGRREESVEMRKWFSRNATTYMAVDPTQQLDWSKIISVIK
jgi:uncharacterized protein with von Willebrand factor type A (vWA) domain